MPRLVSQSSLVHNGQNQAQWAVMLVAEGHPKEDQPPTRPHRSVQDAAHCRLMVVSWRLKFKIMSTHYNVMLASDLPCWSNENLDNVNNCPSSEMGYQREERICSVCGNCLIFNPDQEDLSDDDVLGIISE